MSIPRKSILKAIERIEQDETVSNTNKEFLSNWLKDGLTGPDELLRQEINNKGRKV